MAISRVVSVKVALIGDGAATTYALNTSTGCYEICDQAPNTPPSVGLSLAIGSLVTGVAQASGVTQVNKISYTAAFATNTVTLTFASAIPNGSVDYVTLQLIVP